MTSGGSWLRRIVAVSSRRATAWRLAGSLVDNEWYRASYPEAAGSANALRHYLNRGWKQGLDPCPHFWTDWYLHTYPDVAARGVNPLLHYLAHGAGEGRNPAPSFDTSWYLTRYPDVAGAGMNPLLHFVRHGAAEGRQPAPYSHEQLVRSALAAGDAASASKLFSTMATYVRRTSGSTAVRGRIGAVWEHARATRAPSPAFAQASGWDVNRASDFNDGRPFEVGPYVVELDRVTILPGSATLITEQGELLNDEIAFTRRSFPELEPKSPDVMFLRDGTTMIRHGAVFAPRIGTGILLTKEHEQNYFHWLVEVLARLHAIEAMGAPGDIPLLISDDLGANLMEALRSVKHPDRRIIALKRNVPCRVDRLIYASDVTRILDLYETAADHRHAYFPVELLADFADSVVRRCGAPGTAGRRRLFLARQSTRRSVLNQPELLRIAVADGIEPVAIEALDFHTQVALMDQAAMVIGPTGAAFANLLWCRPGTRVLIFYPDHPNNNRTFWNALAAARGLELTYLDGPRAFRETGMYAVHDSYRIDIGAFARAIGARPPEGTDQS